jgi:FKBP-type peptidyl-prolyl cis-trans isomerase 2
MNLLRHRANDQNEQQAYPTKSPQGRAIAMRVHPVKEKTVVVDLNYPLVGKTLNFDVKVTDIKAAEPK